MPLPTLPTGLMSVVTTPTLDGSPVKRHLVLVSGEAILGEDLDYEHITVKQAGGMLMVGLSGIAVRV